MEVQMILTLEDLLSLSNTLDVLIQTRDGRRTLAIDHSSFRQR